MTGVQTCALPICEPETAAPAPVPAGASAQTGAPPVADAGSGTVATAGQPYRPKLFTVAGVGAGTPGRRSRAFTGNGRTVAATRRPGGASGAVHLLATVWAAAHTVASRCTAPDAPPGRRVAATVRPLPVNARDRRPGVPAPTPATVNSLGRYGCPAVATVPDPASATGGAPVCADAPAGTGAGAAVSGSQIGRAHV